MEAKQSSPTGVRPAGGANAGYGAPALEDPEQIDLLTNVAPSGLRRAAGPAVVVILLLVLIRVLRGRRG